MSSAGNAKFDLQQFIEQESSKSMLKFITCGSVDDGKSTLIGRLLYDSQLLYDDQLEELKKDSKGSTSTEDEIDFSLLVDGLAAEREQGITIDVAYRFFSTSKRNPRSAMILSCLTWLPLLKSSLHCSLVYSPLSKKCVEGSTFVSSPASAAYWARVFFNHVCRE